LAGYFLNRQHSGLAFFGFCMILLYAHIRAVTKIP